MIYVLAALAGACVYLIARERNHNERISNLESFVGKLGNRVYSLECDIDPNFDENHSRPG